MASDLPTFRIEADDAPVPTIEFGPRNRRITKKMLDATPDAIHHNQLLQLIGSVLERPRALRTIERRKLLFRDFLAVAQLG
jgi:hypothetical protein